MKTIEWFRYRLSSEANQHGVAGAGSDAESEEENEDGDYTVFECPGLATVKSIEYYDHV